MTSSAVRRGAVIGRRKVKKHKQKVENQHNKYKY